MEGEQNEVSILIEVKYDEACTPDKDFYIELLKSDDKRIRGDDTECKITILDTDNPGVIGFAERVAVVRPRDKIMFLELVRDKGADGDVACDVKITTNNPLLPGKPA